MKYLLTTQQFVHQSQFVAGCVLHMKVTIDERQEYNYAFSERLTFKVRLSLTASRLFPFVSRWTLLLMYFSLKI